MTPKILERSRPGTSILDFSNQEIESFLQEKLRQHKVVEAYIFGSYAQNRASAWSDIDLVVVTRTELPFLERPSQFANLFDLGIPLDLLVYTPEEFRQLKGSDSGFWRSFQQHHLKIL